MHQSPRLPSTLPPSEANREEEEDDTKTQQKPTLPSQVEEDRLVVRVGEEEEEEEEGLRQEVFAKARHNTKTDQPRSATMNWFLIIVAIVVVITTLLISLRLLRVYLDPEEKHQGGGYLPKTCVVLGISLSAFASLLLPFDVANRADPTILDDAGGGLDLALLWMITLWSVCGMVIVVLPFALYYYEAWDPDNGKELTKDMSTNTTRNPIVTACSQFFSALCWTGVTVVVFAALLLIIYFGAGIDTAIIPYTSLTCRAETVAVEPCYRLANTTSCPPEVLSEPYAQKCIEADGELKVKVSIFVATVALLSVLGWLFFVVFGGVGLSSLPLDMCYSYYENRLMAMDRHKFVENREAYKREARELLAIAGQVQEKLKSNKQQLKKVNALQLAVDQLEKKHQRNQSYNQQSPFVKLASPFIIYGRLLLAVLCVAWSLMWVLHIIVNNTVDAHPLLNNMFSGLDDAFSLLGTLAYASFSFYLLWATVNGCFKVGVNFLIFTIHPMKLHGTLMSSFLFNIILILLATVASVSFCSMSFRQYAANTVVDTLYSSYVNKMQYLSYPLQYLQYGLLGFAALGFLWYCCKGPRSIKKILEDEE